MQEAEDTAYTPEERVQIKAVREHLLLYAITSKQGCGPRDERICWCRRRQNEQDDAAGPWRGRSLPQLLALNERMLANAQERSTRLGLLVNVFRTCF